MFRDCDSLFANCVMVFVMVSANLSLLNCNSVDFELFVVGSLWLLSIMFDLEGCMFRLRYGCVSG